MGTTTELYRVTKHDDAHTVAVLLAEERHGTHLAGLVDGHFTVFLTRNGIANHLVGEMLNLTDFLGSHLAEV